MEKKTRFSAEYFALAMRRFAVAWLL